MRITRVNGMKFTATRDKNTVSIKELWVLLYELSARVAEDNNCPVHGDKYPIKTRNIQLARVKSIVRAIEETHNLNNNTTLRNN